MNYKCVQSFFLGILLTATAGTACIRTSATDSLPELSLISYLQQPCLGQGFCYLYVSTTTGNGGTFGGISGMDATCASEKPAAAPANGTYKTMAMAIGVREQNKDWVLHANTEYRRPDGVTVIGRTNSSSVFDLAVGLDNALGPFATPYTGISFVNAVSWNASIDHCGAWNNSGLSGRIGNRSVTTSAFITNGGSIGCGSSLGFYCVQY